MSRGSRKLTVLFVLVVVPAAGMLVWLGLQLLAQDRTLWAKRESERRGLEADAVVRKLDEALKAALNNVKGAPHVLWLANWPANPHILWTPMAATFHGDFPERFADAEAVEFRGGAAEALARYEQLLHDQDMRIRAGALLRAARVHRGRREWDAALSAYGDLAKIESVGWEGVAASLVARRAACSVLEEEGRKRELAQAAAALEKDFLDGRWTLDRSAWDLTRMNIEQWTGHKVKIAEEDWVFTAASDRLWEDRRREARWLGERRRTLSVEGVIVTMVERFDDRGFNTALVLPEAVRGWVREMKTQDPVSVVAESGSLIAGPLPEEKDPATVRRRAEELPWTVYLNPGDPSRAAQELAGRTRLLSWGLAAIVLLLAGGSYLLWRVIHQELAVARLQTEFVAAVSHEFRTPLASLRHVTELLEEDDDLPRGERSKFYQALGRNTERLSRLVESLLDFARMEGGRRPYDLRPLDARALVERVVEDFRGEASSRGFEVELAIEDAGELMVNADEESMSHALWNLLDNALKYSPEGRVVRVSVHTSEKGVAIAVEDHGLGIPQHERGEIFRRFVRGAKARELGIKGTGLGLAMVSHIVESHRGKVEVESREGAGSTFRVVLPAA